ncbi:TPA: hypothetical protein N0F65_005652 [Lagenidium giganteum]|uniref:Uncharacterized protein n=1 Tax=Lagenidium giganteum TaxID=4803 RepID=A0AAV2ZET5_9STRA|nr:TPA: hypothetical protein N0F65_005652 [Lagenidium giganteum]
MRYGEDDPEHGVLRVTGWGLDVEAKLGEAATLFAREWQPLTRSNTNEPIPRFFVRGTKPHRN